MSSSHRSSLNCFQSLPCLHVVSRTTSSPLCRWCKELLQWRGQRVITSRNVNYAQHIYSMYVQVRQLSRKQPLQPQSQNMCVCVPFVHSFKVAMCSYLIYPVSIKRTGLRDGISDKMDFQKFHKSTDDGSKTIGLTDLLQYT